MNSERSAVSEEEAAGMESGRRGVRRRGRSEDYSQPSPQLATSLPEIGRTVAGRGSRLICPSTRMAKVPSSCMVTTPFAQEFMVRVGATGLLSAVARATRSRAAAVAMIFGMVDLLVQVKG